MGNLSLKMCLMKINPICNYDKGGEDKEESEWAKSSQKHEIKLKIRQKFREEAMTENMFLGLLWSTLMNEYGF